MANPNIVSVVDIKGNNSLVNLSTTSNTQIVTNAASSGKVYKINSIVVSNVDTSNTCNVTVNMHDADDIGGTAYPIVSSITIPAAASLIVTDKSTGFYLKEDQSVSALAETANSLTVTASWEEIES